MTIMPETKIGEYFTTSRRTQNGSKIRIIFHCFIQTRYLLEFSVIICVPCSAVSWCLPCSSGFPGKTLSCAWGHWCKCCHKKSKPHAWFHSISCTGDHPRPPGASSRCVSWWHRCDRIFSYKWDTLTWWPSSRPIHWLLREHSSIPDTCAGCTSTRRWCPCSRCYQAIALGRRKNDKSWKTFRTLETK